MICDVKIAHLILKDYCNFALKENFFSLKNVDELIDKSLKIKLKWHIDLFILHIKNCLNC